MCTTKTPKPQPPAPNQVPKDPVYMANSWLDGIGINGEAMGRNSLRIDPGTPRAHPITRPPVIFKPPFGGGGGGGGGGLGIGGGGFGRGTHNGFRGLTN